MEACDDRNHRNRIAGGVALPQLGQHVSDLPREVVLPLSRRLERASHGSTGAGQGISRNTGTKLPTEGEHRPRHGERRVSRGFQRRVVDCLV